LFGKRRPQYFEHPVEFADVGICSDDDCPCDPLGVPIARGSGYLYISPKCVKFRRNCHSWKKYETKRTRMFQPLLDQGATVIDEAEPRPILICKQGAVRRGLDLSVAAADAARWWRNGMVPLRPTPLDPSTPHGKSS
jgi:hypothetical protein